jgi:hypothetical protein
LLLVPREIGRLDSAQLFVGDTAIETKVMASKKAPKPEQRLYEVQLTKAEHAMLLGTGDLRARTRSMIVRFAPSGLLQVQRTLNACVANLLERCDISKVTQADLASSRSETETSD